MTSSSEMSGPDCSRAMFLNAVLEFGGERSVGSEKLLYLQNQTFFLSRMIFPWSSDGVPNAQATECGSSATTMPFRRVGAKLFLNSESALVIRNFALRASTEISTKLQRNFNETSGSKTKLHVRSPKDA